MQKLLLSCTLVVQAWKTYHTS